MSRLARVIQHLALALFGVVLALAGLEAALRLTALALRPPAPAALADTGRHAGHRVLCLGESTTAGTSWRKEDAYPPQLERLLLQRAPGKVFTVVNGGVAATTSDRILQALDDDLTRYRPDIVVTMIGINDGAPSDPMFPTGGGLRVWKLARLLYYGLWAPPAPMATDGGGRPVATIPRRDGQVAWDVPEQLPQRLFVAANDILAGELDRAERTLLELAEVPDEGGFRRVRSDADGQLLVISLQRRRPDDERTYRERLHELVDTRVNPSTAANYGAIARILRERGILHVAVQYPMRPLAPLQTLLGDAPNLVYVDNESTFVDLLRTRPAREIFLDLFAGEFGHLTPEANRILASRVADGIARALAAGTPDTANRR